MLHIEQRDQHARDRTAYHQSKTPREYRRWLEHVPAGMPKYDPGHHADRHDTDTAKRKRMHV